MMTRGMGETVALGKGEIVIVIVISKTVMLFAIDERKGNVEDRIRAHDGDGDSRR